jgi:hypothetical protein
MHTNHKPQPQPQNTNNPNPTTGGGGPPDPTERDTLTRYGCSVRSAGFKTSCGCNQMTGSGTTRILRAPRWRTRRYRVRVKWLAVKRWYLTRRFGLSVTMLPILRKGRFVSVEQHGPFLDLRDEESGDVIRLIPYQPNHGVMVEKWVDGRMAWRSHCDMKAFSEMGFGERHG